MKRKTKLYLVRFAVATHAIMWGAFVAGITFGEETTTRERGTGWVIGGLLVLYTWYLGRNWWRQEKLDILEGNDT